MLHIDGETLPELEQAHFTVFGTGEVFGAAEIATTQHNLAEPRFYTDASIPIIGEEYMVRSFTPTTNPSMFDYIRVIQPTGLITFGVGTLEAAKHKPYGTHLDILLREWAKEGMLSLSIEGIYHEKRVAAISKISEMIGSRTIRMSRIDDDIQITTLEDSSIFPEN